MIKSNFNCFELCICCIKKVERKIVHFMDQCNEGARSNSSEIKNSFLIVLHVVGHYKCVTEEN